MIITIGSVLPDDKGNEYKVIDNINPGGFGQVFLCEWTSDRKKFSLKAMLSVFPSSEEYMVFQNELQSSKKIAGANINKYEYMHDGASANALYLTIVEMSEVYELNLYEYLKYLLEHRPNRDMTNDELAKLAPCNEDVRERCGKGNEQNVSVQES